MVQRAYEPMNSGITLENGRYGRRAILNSAWLDYFVQYLADNAVVELELNYAKGWHGQSLSFLAELPSLKAFEIFDFNIPDIKEIHRLHNLRRLGVTTYCSTEIDFARKLCLGMASQSRLIVQMHDAQRCLRRSIQRQGRRSVRPACQPRILVDLECASGKPARLERLDETSISATGLVETTP